MAEQILILGIGNLLFTDEGFGVHVMQQLDSEYDFDDNVMAVDGGVLGLNLISVISDADKLIVIDAVKDRQPPGTLYRIDKEGIPERIRAKNSLHQVDFLETLAVCQALEIHPETVIFGVEPEDIESFGIELSKTTASKVDKMIEMVLLELDRFGAGWKKKEQMDVPCDSVEDNGNQQWYGPFGR